VDARPPFFLSTTPQTKGKGQPQHQDHRRHDSAEAVTVQFAVNPGARQCTQQKKRRSDVVETFQEIKVQHPYAARAVVPQPPRYSFPTLAEVVNVLYTRMRPDLIVFGEMVGNEAGELLAAIGSAAPQKPAGVPTHSCHCPAHRPAPRTAPSLARQAAAHSPVSPGGCRAPAVARRRALPAHEFLVYYR